MDIAEFAEKFCGVELPEWQKNYIRTLYEMGTDAKIYICMPKNLGRNQAYIHINNIKELIHDGQNATR